MWEERRKEERGGEKATGWKGEVGRERKEEGEDEETGEEMRKEDFVL